jgi:hypothetical protein
LSAQPLYVCVAYALQLRCPGGSCDEDNFFPNHLQKSSGARRERPGWWESVRCHRGVPADVHPETSRAWIEELMGTTSGGKESLPWFSSPTREADGTRLGLASPSLAEIMVCLDWRAPTVECLSPQATVVAPSCLWHLSPLCVKKLDVLALQPSLSLRLSGNCWGCFMKPLLRGSAS